LIPSITLLVVVVLLIVCIRRVGKIKTLKKNFQNMKRVGSEQKKILFFMAQVISSFVSISNNTGEKKQHPQPASSVANALGAANLGRVRTSCCCHPIRPRHVQNGAARIVPVSRRCVLNHFNKMHAS